MPFRFVVCSVCNKKFLKDNRHINENKKLGHNFYCSPLCFSSVKNKQVKLICENPNCHNAFRRTPSDKSFRNFCSRKCAMTIIGPENGLKHRKYRYCQYCGKKLTANYKYCSPKCWGLAHTLSKEQLISELNILAQQLGRSPTKRECKFSSSCERWFKSWNNALIEAGLIPHRSLNQRMYSRRKCIAVDGHFCNSISELLIDNWFNQNKIGHQKEFPYPKGKFVADWAFSANIFVEYFGLANDSKRYDEEIKKKKLICKESKINLIEIYSKDLFPKNKLKQLFQTVTK